MPQEPISFETTVKRTRERFNKIAPSVRPVKITGGGKARTEEERKALFRASYWDTKKAEQTGFIVKTERGYRMSWTTGKKS